MPQLDQQQVESLAEYDEQVRSGAECASTSADVVIEIPNLRELVECVDFLENVWPRHIKGPPLAVPNRLGRFEIVRLLGHGGFGIVYLAVDPALERQVALKVPRLHALAEPQLVQRFQREARAAAQLDHPHIVPVYETGETDGLCYIASAYCAGPTLAKWISEHARSGATVRLAAEWVASLADAVAYSHAHGVLHRDIKPGNVMLVASNTTEAESTPRHVRGDPASQFVPRLADFGLAKSLEETISPAGGDAPHETIAQGTPAYMAPEQIKGSSVPHTPATDIYALGAVLFELLAGRAPFVGANVAEVLLQVERADPPTIRALRQTVPRDLETICLKCLRKIPGDRYLSAVELRDDLQRFLVHEPIRARPHAAWELAVKWVHRRPALAMVMGALLVAVAAIAGVQVSKRQSLARVNDSLRQANSELSLALGESQRLQRDLIERETSLRQNAYAIALDRAERDLRNLRYQSARELLAGFVPDDDAVADLRGTEWDFLWEQVRDVRPVREFSDGRGVPLLCAALSADGGLLTTGDNSGRIAVWDVQSGRSIATWQAHDTRVKALRFSPDSRYVASGGSFRLLCVWDTNTWTSVQSFTAHDGTIEAIDFSPDGDTIATGGRDGHVRLWDWHRMRKLGEWQPLQQIDGNVIYQVRFSAEGQRLTSTTAEGGISVLNLTTGAAQERQLPHTATNLVGSDLSADGRLLVAGGYGAALTILSTGDNAPLRIPRENFTIRSAAVSGNGQRVCFTGHGTILDYELSDDLRTCVQERRWTSHPAEITGSVLSADGRWLVTVGEDGTARLWDLPSRPRPVTSSVWLPPRFNGAGDDIAFSPGGKWLAVSAEAGNSSVLGVLDMQRKVWRHLFRSRRRATRSLQFSTDGNHLFAMVYSSGFEPRIGVWNLEAGTGPEFEGIDRVEDFAVLGDGGSLLVARNEGSGEIGIWDRREKRLVRTLAKNCGHISTLELTADQRRVCIVGDDRPLIIDVQKGQVTFAGDAATSVVAVHPNGEQIVYIGESEVRLADVRGQEILMSAPIHPDANTTRAVSISPNGRLLATITREISNPERRGVMLWDLQLRRSLFTLATHDQKPWCLAWSPDSSTLAAVLRSSGVPDGRDVILWHLGASERGGAPNLRTEIWK